MHEKLVDKFIATGLTFDDVLIAPRTKKELGQHPLEIIAAREFENRNRPGTLLDLETMTEWLCRISGQPYLRIDPLKINVNAVTEVMSYAFAQRHNILAVEVNDDEVVIASAQPFMAQWEGMLTQTLRGRSIRRVVAIDLPQLVDVVANPNGMALLERDCRNVCEWFTRRGYRCDASELFAQALGEMF